MTIVQDGQILTLSIPQSIYSEDILFKCFYWYTGKYSLEITKNSDDYIVRIEMLIGEKSDELVKKIKLDLIDFKLRDIVTKETKLIRELLVAKAFAFDDYDNNPKESISDPVGFNPLEV